MSIACFVLIKLELWKPPSYLMCYLNWHFQSASIKALCWLRPWLSRKLIHVLHMRIYNIMLTFDFKDTFFN